MDAPTTCCSITHDGAWATSRWSCSSVAALAVLVGVVVTLVRRWRRWPQVKRSALAPVLWTGGVGMFLIVLGLAIEVLGGQSDWLTIAGLLPLSCVPFAFLFGLLRTRLSSADALSSLVEALRDPASRSDLGLALATALDDEELRLAYWVPATESYVDAAGRAGRHGRRRRGPRLDGGRRRDGTDRRDRPSRAGRGRAAAPRRRGRGGEAGARERAPGRRAAGAAAGPGGIAGPDRRGRLRGAQAGRARPPRRRAAAPRRPGAQPPPGEVDAGRATPSRRRRSWTRPARSWPQATDELRELARGNPSRRADLPRACPRRSRRSRHEPRFRSRWRPS